MESLYEEIISESDKEYNFSFVDTIYSKTQDDLYFHAKSFFVETYPSSTEVIQLDDKERGVIAGKSAFAYEVDNKTITYFYYLKIQCREERYKVELRDISYVISYSGGDKSQEFFLKDIDEEYMDNLSSDLAAEAKVKLKRTVRDVRPGSPSDSKKAEHKKVLTKLTYNILNGAIRNVDEMFLSISNYMHTNIAKDTTNDW